MREDKSLLIMEKTISNLPNKPTKARSAYGQQLEYVY